MKGLEPPRLSPLDPKSSAATNYATSAFCSAKVIEVYEFANIIRFFSSFTSRYNPFFRTFYNRIPIWSICHIHKNIGSNPKFSVFFINIINGRSGKTHRPAIRQFRRYRKTASTSGIISYLLAATLSLPIQNYSLHYNNGDLSVRRQVSSNVFDQKERFLT